MQTKTARIRLKRIFRVTKIYEKRYCKQTYFHVKIKLNNRNKLKCIEYVKYSRERMTNIIHKHLKWIVKKLNVKLYIIVT